MEILWKKKANCIWDAEIDGLVLQVIEISKRDYFYTVHKEGEKKAIKSGSKSTVFAAQYMCGEFCKEFFAKQKSLNHV